MTKAPELNTSEAALAYGRGLAAAGRRVVAVIGWRVPVEPIAAAGFAYVQVVPDLERPTPNAERLLGSAGGPEYRSLVELAASGDLGFADLIVAGPGYASLAASLENLRRHGLLDEATPPTFYYEALVQRDAWSLEFTVESVQALIQRLFAMNGGASPAAQASALRAAIVEANKDRAEVRKLLERRRDGGVAGSLIVDAIAQAGRAEPGDVIRQVKELGGRSPAQDKSPRILIVSSSVLYDSRLHRLIEARGMQVIAEDDIHGDAFGASDVADDGDPCRALGAHYHDNQPISRISPRALRMAWFKGHLLRPDIDGVVFYAEDPLWGWDVPSMSQQLDALGKPWVLARGDVRRPEGRQAMERALEGFAARLRKEGVPA